MVTPTKSWLRLDDRREPRARETPGGSHRLEGFQ